MEPSNHKLGKSMVSFSHGPPLLSFPLKLTPLCATKLPVSANVFLVPEAKGQSSSVLPSLNPPA